MRQKIIYPYGQPPEGEDVLWRVDPRRYSGVSIDVNGCEHYYNSDTKFQLSWYKITKRTPKGAWIFGEGTWTDKKFILLTARKQWASETQHKAIECFLRRKERHLYILNNQVREVEGLVNLAKHFLEETRPKSEDENGT